jgi:hypothetical protein
MIKPKNFFNFVEFFTSVRWQGRHKLGDQLIRLGLLAQFNQEWRKVLRHVFSLPSPSKASQSAASFATTSAATETLLYDDKFAKGETDLIGGNTVLPLALDSVMPRTENGEPIGPVSVNCHAYVLLATKTMLLKAVMPSVGQPLSSAAQQWSQRINIPALQQADVPEFAADTVGLLATALSLPSTESPFPPRTTMFCRCKPASMRHRSASKGWAS